MSSGLTQIGIVADLLNVIAQHTDQPIDSHQMNVILEAASLIEREFHRSPPNTPGLSGWIMSNKVGRSSLAMAQYLAPFAGLTCPPHPYSPVDAEEDYPRDAADFKRCETLLVWVPELRPYLHEIAHASPIWAAYVQHWEELRKFLVPLDSPNLQSIASTLLSNRILQLERETNE